MSDINVYMIYSEYYRYPVCLIYNLIQILVASYINYIAVSHLTRSMMM